MKKLVVTDKTACKACLSCVIACSEAFYKEFDPDKSCIQIVSKTGTDATVKACIQCGKCEQHCPQHIPIRKELKNAAGELETISYKAARWAIQRFKLW